MRMSDWSSDVFSTDLIRREGSSGELGKRISDPVDQKLLRHLIATMGSIQDETLRILFLDGIGRLIADEQVQRGTVHQLVIYPRPIFRRALEHNAASLILVHNHPSGDATRSEERRVGQECVSTCRSRWSPYHAQKKDISLSSKAQLVPTNKT